MAAHQHASKLLLRKALGARDHGDTRGDQQHLDRTGARVGTSMESGNETRHGDIEESRGRKSQRVRQRVLRLTQSKVRHHGTEHRGESGEEIEHQRPRPRQAGLHQDGEIAHAVRYLVRRHRKGR